MSGQTDNNDVLDDIDAIIDKAAAEKNDQDDIEKMRSELEAQKEINEKAEAEKAKIEADAQAKLDEEAKSKKAEEDAKLDPVMLEMKSKIEEMEEKTKQEQITRVTSGLATLTEELPELMTNKDVMDKPIMPGSVTAREYLTDLIADVGMSEAKKAAQTIMKLNEIKPKSTRGALPDGKGASGNDTSDTASKEVKERQANIGKMFDAMQKGTLAREVAKRKGM